MNDITYNREKSSMNEVLSRWEGKHVKIRDIIVRRVVTIVLEVDHLSKGNLVQTFDLKWQQIYFVTHCDQIAKNDW